VFGRQGIAAQFRSTQLEIASCERRQSLPIFKTGQILSNQVKICESRRIEGDSCRSVCEELAELMLLKLRNYVRCEELSMLKLISQSHHLSRPTRDNGRPHDTRQGTYLMIGHAY
jgi:hypothetical protein